MTQAQRKHIVLQSNIQFYDLMSERGGSKWSYLATMTYIDFPLILTQPTCILLWLPLVKPRFKTSIP